uniref:Myosuppressin n=1 Tax=Cacopsylla melanoneura TaxID=428564 RepID=A0A8D8XAQ1_9HEMI
MKWLQPFVLFVMFTIFMKKSLAMPPLQCTPGFVDQIPFKIRKICVALSTIYELSNAMESYIDDNGSMDQFVNPENNQLMENGVKRQDLDHVFLRFGKRRR